MEENKKVKIYVACLKKCAVPSNEYLYPIQVGTEYSKKKIKRWLHDNEGDNISSKNPRYCELTAQYWAWKNDEADYYGFFHYRRYLAFSNNVKEADRYGTAQYEDCNEDTLKELGFNMDLPAFIGDYDIIAPMPTDVRKGQPISDNNYEQYKLSPFLHINDLDKVIEILKNKYPDYCQDADDYMKSTVAYYCNMFIMRKEVFCDYCKWLFDILSDCETEIDFSNYSKEETRVMGHLSERLFGIFYLHCKRIGLKTTELRRVQFRLVGGRLPSENTTSRIKEWSSKILPYNSGSRETLKRLIKRNNE